MRRIVRGILWVVKGVLLAIALAALILWRWSYQRESSLNLSRSTLHQSRVHVTLICIGAAAGRIAIERRDVDYPVERTEPIRILIDALGAGWHWFIGFGPKGSLHADTGQSHGLFRWISSTGYDGDTSVADSYAYIPGWFLSLSTAAWPLTSLTLLYRRRARLRRLARAGCCSQCGYDLGATAEKTGPLLPRCPECGATSPAEAFKRECSAKEHTKNTEAN